MATIWDPFPVSSKGKHRKIVYVDNPSVRTHTICKYCGEQVSKSRCYNCGAPKKMSNS